MVGSEPNFSLDKTYREIMTAVEAGAAVNIYKPEGDYLSISPILSIGGTAQDGYIVVIRDHIARADTPDDYPVLVS